MKANKQNYSVACERRGNSLETDFSTGAGKLALPLSAWLENEEREGFFLLTQLFQPVAMPPH